MFILIYFFCLCEYLNGQFCNAYTFLRTPKQNKKVCIVCFEKNKLMREITMTGSTVTALQKYYISNSDMGDYKYPTNICSRDRRTLDLTEKVLKHCELLVNCLFQCDQTWRLPLVKQYLRLLMDATLGKLY